MCCAGALLLGMFKTSDQWSVCSRVTVALLGALPKIDKPGELRLYVPRLGPDPN